MKRPQSSLTGKNLSVLGQSLAIVFEFLGMLGFSGLVGYALQRWVWPDHAALILIVSMMGGLAVGLYHIVQRIRSRPPAAIVHHEHTSVPSRSVADAEQSLHELRELRRKLDEMGRPDAREGDDA